MNAKIALCMVAALVVSRAVAGNQAVELQTNEEARFRTLQAMAERVRLNAQDAFVQGERGPEGSAEPEQGQSQSPDVSLVSDAGRAFVGHQLEFFDVDDQGVVGTSKPAWISLYRTEGRSFALSGEVMLGGMHEEMLFPGDLPDGFALFLREWGGLQRYQLDSRRMTVKRRLLGGQPIPNIMTVFEFRGPAMGEWIPFNVQVSESMIRYSFGDVTGLLQGPLATDGANKVAIAPGTQLRNLRLAVSGGLGEAKASREPLEIRSGGGPSGRRVQVVEPTRERGEPPVDLESKMHAVWQFGLAEPENDEHTQSLMAVFNDENEVPAVRLGALNALGHRNVTNADLLRQINQTIERSPELFSVSKNHELSNPDFEAGAVVRQGDLAGVFGETMFAPGSSQLPGWSVFEGFLTWRTDIASAGGGHVIELGPRDVPGCISQTVRTTTGQQYELEFRTCTGRGQFHFNRELRIRTGDLDVVIDCPVGSNLERVQLKFRARSPLTSISFCGVGNSGFGPVLDDISIRPVAE